LVGDPDSPPSQGDINNSIAGVTNASGTEVPDASAVNYQTVIIPAIQACTTAYKAGGGNISSANGDRWGWGAMSMTLFIADTAETKARPCLAVYRWSAT
jgi:hypothetical protein